MTLPFYHDAQEQRWGEGGGRTFKGGQYLDAEELDWDFFNWCGVESHTEVLCSLLEGIDGPILEVGCGRGNELQLLYDVGHHDLTGIEIDRRVVNAANEKRPHLKIKHGSAYKLPFPDKSFDAVFTVGLLIHIRPTEVKQVCKEILRVARKRVCGLEYWTPEFVQRSNEKTWSGPYTDVYGIPVDVSIRYPMRRNKVGTVEYFRLEFE